VEKLRVQRVKKKLNNAGYSSETDKKKTGDVPTSSAGCSFKSKSESACIIQFRIRHAVQCTVNDMAAQDTGLPGHPDTV
jgi:hypothetical protein